MELADLPKHFLLEAQCAWGAGEGSGHGKPKTFNKPSFYDSRRQSASEDTSSADVICACEPDTASGKLKCDAADVVDMWHM